MVVGNGEVVPPLLVLVEELALGVLEEDGLGSGRETFDYKKVINIFLL